MADKFSGASETTLRDELGRAAEERSLPVLSLASDPDFDPLRGDERFTALVNAIGVR